MPSLRKLLRNLLLFAILCSSARTLLAAGDQLKLAATQFAPYEFEEKNRVVGINVDIVQEAFDRME